jgi:putative flippase GtrA
MNGKEVKRFLDSTVYLRLVTVVLGVILFLLMTFFNINVYVLAAIIVLIILVVGYMLVKKLFFEKR